jgi:hypothetical protein
MSDASNTLETRDRLHLASAPDNDLSPQQIALRLSYPWLVLSAFALYWLTFLALETHNGSSSFGADSVLYNAIAYGNIQPRLIRFHPATVGLAVAWMKIFTPFSYWIAPHHLLAALFAVIGAVGVRAALWAFELVVPRRYVLLCGIIYACSLGVWYFSSIGESKILTAMLSTLYIALYLHLRKAWSWQGAAVLTLVLGAACLNEIVSAFLVVIPAADAVLQRRLDFKTVRWIAAHFVVPVLFVIVDMIINERLGPEPMNAESGSSASMFWFYVGISDHSLSSLYGFLLNWFCFNVAAPTPNAYAAVSAWPTYFGYFEPSFANYFDDFVSMGVVAIAGLMAVASLAPGWRAERLSASAIILPLLAFTIVRGAFFFVFNPAEVMLFSSAVTLPNLVLLLAPFAASRFPAKALVLGCFGALLFAVNLRFMIV